MFNLIAQFIDLENRIWGAPCCVLDHSIDLFLGGTHKPFTSGDVEHYILSFVFHCSDSMVEELKKVKDFNCEND